MQIVAPKNTDFQEYANIPGEEREREREGGGENFTLLVFVVSIIIAERNLMIRIALLHSWQ
jgi:hypothetical protein